MHKSIRPVVCFDNFLKQFQYGFGANNLSDIYEVQSIQTYPTSSGNSNVSWSVSYYDISTKQFLGDARVR